MSARVENIKDYFSLHYENRKLAEENATVLQQAGIILFHYCSWIHFIWRLIP